MHTLHAFWLGLGMFWQLAGLAPNAPLPPTQVVEEREADPAVLCELLFDRQHPRGQSQAALLLVRSHAAEAERIIRTGLRQSNAPEVFLSLASAVRIARDGRFVEELFLALSSAQAPVRQAAAESLGVLANADALLRLQALVEDPHVERSTRLAALLALGRNGRKVAAVILLDQLSSGDETIRRAAAAALADLSGQKFDLDVSLWRDWWERRCKQSSEGWLEDRLAYQVSRAHRLEGDLERSQGQIVRLHQQLHERLPAGDRLAHLQELAAHEDAAVRALAIAWSVELLAAGDAVGKRVVTEVLLRLSRDSATDVQRPAVLALARDTDPRAFERLQSLLRRGQPSVRAAAARALTQQAAGPTAEARARQRLVIPALQKALEDPALEVVVEAAEDLGSLGVPETGPVLAVLLHHPSEPVRLASAQALERTAGRALLEGLLSSLDDPCVTVRFSLVGALGRIAEDGHALTDSQRDRLVARLETLLLRDTDPGVRSRAATVLGEIGSPALLVTLWQRVRASEDSRVQEKAWAAFLDIVARSHSLELFRQWDERLAEAKQLARRTQFLLELASRWAKTEETRALATAVQVTLTMVYLDQGKWAAAFPHLRELLAQPASEAETEQRLNWLLTVGELALQDDNHAEALRVVREAQPFLVHHVSLAAAFEKLAEQARIEP